MDPELQKSIADIMTVVKDGITYAALSARDELPSLITEYLRWAAVSTTLWMAVNIAMVFVWLWLGLFCRDYKYAINSSGGEGRAIGMAMGNVGFRVIAGFWVMIVVSFAADLLQLAMAPRIYLLQRLSDLVR